MWGVILGATCLAAAIGVPAWRPKEHWAHVVGAVLFVFFVAVAIWIVGAHLIAR
jgi:hypothetical protein